MTLLKGPDWGIFGIGQRVLSPDNAFKTQMKSPKAGGVIIIITPRREGGKEQTIKKCLEKCNFHDEKHLFSLLIICGCF